MGKVADALARIEDSGRPKVAAGMPLVVIESPYYGRGTDYEGDIEGNVEYARLALLDSYMRGEAPICSHLLGPQVLDDEDEVERATGMSAGRLWAVHAHIIAFYTDRGISEGMRQMADHTRFSRPEISIEYRTLNTA